MVNCSLLRGVGKTGAVDGLESQGEHHRHQEIQQRGADVDLEASEGQRVDALRSGSELLGRNRGHDAGRQQQQHKLPGERWKDDAQGRLQDDVSESLQGRQAQSSPGLGLSPWNCIDAPADDLGRESTQIQAQRCLLYTSDAADE